MFNAITIATNIIFVTTTTATTYSTTTFTVEKRI